MAPNLNDFVCEQFQENYIEFDEQIVIKIDDSSFGQEILKKAYGNESFDVTLITEADSTSVSAHRMVLVAASEYFSTMFTTVRDQQIKIKGITGESLKLLVNYCYTGQIEINWRNVVDLLASASMMRVVKIENKCKEFFEKQLEARPNSSLGIHLIALKYSFTDLAENSLKNICEHFENLSKMREFNKIDFSVMERILKSGERFDVTEKEIFEVAMKWVDFARSQRQQFIPSILKLIRLTQIDSTYLFEKVQPICESNDCSKLIMAALYWHSLPEQRLLPVKQTTKRMRQLRILYHGWNESDTISLRIYCPRSDEWISVDLFKSPVKLDKSFGFAIINEMVYVTGKKMFALNVRTLELSYPAPMMTCRYYHSVAVVDKIFYVIGGVDEANMLNTVERYDAEKDEWKICAPMLKPRSRAGVTVLNDCLYVCGGFGSDGNANNSVERYSPSNGTWTYVKSMNFRRSGPGVATLNGKIYVIGGRDKDWLNSVECYNPTTDTWTTVASLLSSSWRVTAIVYHGELFAIGGSRSSSVQRYNTIEDKWTKCKSLNCCRSYPADTMKSKLINMNLFKLFLEDMHILSKTLTEVWHQNKRFFPLVIVLSLILRCFALVLYHNDD